VYGNPYTEFCTYSELHRYKTNSMIENGYEKFCSHVKLHRYKTHAQKYMCENK